MKQLDPEQPDPSYVAASPGQSHVGETPSNGLAERAIQQVPRQARCTTLDLEVELGFIIPCGHPIVAWRIGCAPMLLTNYEIGSSDKIAYHRLRGQPVRVRLQEFCDCVWLCVPRKVRASMGPRWRFGICLRRSWRSDENFIGLADGTAARASAIARPITPKQWQPKRISRTVGAPFDATVSALDITNEAVDPHSSQVPSQDESAVGSMKVPTRVRITYIDIKRVGCSEHRPHAVGIGCVARREQN